MGFRLPLRSSNRARYLIQSIPLKASTARTPGCYYYLAAPRPYLTGQDAPSIAPAALPESPLFLFGFL